MRGRLGSALRGLRTGPGLGGPARGVQQRLRVSMREGAACSCQLQAADQQDRLMVSLQVLAEIASRVTEARVSNQAAMSVSRWSDI